MSPAWKDLLIPSVPWWSLALRTIVAFGAILILLRIAGKRQVGQMAMPELVALLLISNAVQNAMNGGDNSLTAGIGLAFGLVLMSHAFSWATYRSRKLETLIQGRPRLLIHKGKLLHENLKKELLTERELKHLLRRQGMHELREIEEAVLEPDGFISIMRKSEVAAMPDDSSNDIY